MMWLAIRQLIALRMRVAIISMAFRCKFLVVEDRQDAAKERSMLAHSCVACYLNAWLISLTSLELPRTQRVRSALAFARSIFASFQVRNVLLELRDFRGEHGNLVFHLLIRGFQFLNRLHQNGDQFCFLHAV